MLTCTSSKICKYISVTLYDVVRTLAVVSLDCTLEPNTDAKTGKTRLENGLCRAVAQGSMGERDVEWDKIEYTMPGLYAQIR